jgi:hypothetical protein
MAKKQPDKPMEKITPATKAELDKAYEEERQARMQRCLEEIRGILEAEDCAIVGTMNIVGTNIEAGWAVVAK